MNTPQTFTLVYYYLTNKKEDFFRREFHCMLGWKFYMERVPQKKSLSAVLRVDCSSISELWSAECSLDLALVQGESRRPLGEKRHTFSIANSIFRLDDVLPDSELDVPCAWGEWRVECTVRVLEVKGIYCGRRWDLTKESELTDATIISNGTRFHSCRAILASHSRHLKNIFFPETNEESPRTMEFTVYSTPTVRLFLEIVHQFSCIQFEKETTMELLKFANQLEADAVTRSCIAQFEFELRRAQNETPALQTRFSILEMLKLAEQYKLAELEQMVIRNIGIDDLMALLNKNLESSTLDAVRRRLHYFADW